MSEFTLERKLRPTDVNLELLRQLERVMLEDVRPPQGSEQGLGNVREFSISITDAFGTETFTSIAEYRPSLLPDSTNAIGIHYLARESRERLRMDVSFGLASDSNRLKIEVTANAAREAAIGIADSIQKVLAPHHRLPDLAHPGSLLGTAVSFGGVVGFMTFLLAWDSEKVPPWVSSAGLVLLVVSIAHWYAGKLRPFTQFDSVTSRRKNRIWNWFVYGVLSFIVFGGLLTAFRRKLFGFQPDHPQFLVAYSLDSMSSPWTGEAISIKT